MSRTFLLAVLCFTAACAGADQGSGTTGGPVTTAAATTSATGESQSSDSSGSGAPTTGAAGTCGDGTLDPGEDCDDGNAADDDACTSACKLPTCDDGLKNNDESAVDCGGGCEPCPDDSPCHGPEDCMSGVCAGFCVGLYTSCLELHGWQPNLPNGNYDIDPEGDDIPINVYCDMVGGGWTEVALDTLDAIDGWSAGAAGSCGTLSDHLLGGAGQFGAGAATEKTFSLLNVPHMAVRAVASVIIIDSWEGESMRMELDGQPIASGICSQGIPNSCGTVDNQCGAPQYKEGVLQLTGQRDLPGNSVVVGFSSSLDQDANDEAWGVDRVSVQVR